MAAWRVFLLLFLSLMQLAAAAHNSRARRASFLRLTRQRSAPATMESKGKGGGVSMLTVCMTACTPGADWQSLGLYYSFLR